MFDNPELKKILIEKLHESRDRFSKKEYLPYPVPRVHVKP